MQDNLGAPVAPDGLSSQATEPKVSALRASIPSACRNCDGEGWVCENHADRPWGGMSDAPEACECGAGAPCRVCNRQAPRGPWLPISTYDEAEHGSHVLICGGTVLYDAETFPADYPFNGISIAGLDGGEWAGNMGSEYDAQYWHKPTHFAPLPPTAQAMSAGTAETQSGSGQGPPAWSAEPMRPDDTAQDTTPVDAKKKG